ncbi:hypothetical protein VTL71DRAFT_3450, partial [Oculimacula yallundae]
MSKPKPFTDLVSTSTSTLTSTSSTTSIFKPAFTTTICPTCNTTLLASKLIQNKWSCYGFRPSRWLWRGEKVCGEKLYVHVQREWNEKDGYQDELMMN